MFAQCTSLHRSTAMTPASWPRAPRRALLLLEPSLQTASGDGDPCPGALALSDESGRCRGTRPHLCPGQPPLPPLPCNPVSYPCPTAAGGHPPTPALSDVCGRGKAQTPPPTQSRGTALLHRCPGTAWEALTMPLESLLQGVKWPPGGPLHCSVAPHGSEGGGPRRARGERKVSAGKGGDRGV